MKHMFFIREHDQRIVVEGTVGSFPSYVRNQLAFWGFEIQEYAGRFSASSELSNELAIKLVDFFKGNGIYHELDGHIEDRLEQESIAKEALLDSVKKGRQLKEGHIDESVLHDFKRFLHLSIPRTLKSHQLKAALHLLITRNSANFSVPGSGKTTVVLAVFAYLRTLGKVDSLYVVGPPACFGPWKHEYTEVLGAKPKCELTAGGDIATRHYKYLVNLDSVPDLYLTTYQTLQRDYSHVCTLFRRQGLRFFLVVDEAHYIKQIGGAWSSAVLEVAKHAHYRCILTGTPFPKSHTDAFNLFDTLWPSGNCIPSETRNKIWVASEKGEYETSSELLKSCIDPLFYRVRKSDLGLSDQVFLDPQLISMKPFERRIYNAVVDRIRDLSNEDPTGDLEVIAKLKRGRMIRARQAVSYTKLLCTAVEDYDEELLTGQKSLAEIILNYDRLERPAKMSYLLELVGDLVRKGEKVVIWSNFVQTLKRIAQLLTDENLKTSVIYGGTPTVSTAYDEELTREEIIREFVDRSGVLDVLVANPAACAESVSLHKACRNAVYYDLSYNCAQYLQSLDRIHRVGGSESKRAFYHFLQYRDTIESDILENLRGKSRRMSAIIDQNYGIYSLDMFTTDEELDAYERLFEKD